MKCNIQRRTKKNPSSHATKVLLAKNEDMTEGMMKAMLKMHRQEATTAEGYGVNAEVTSGCTYGKASHRRDWAITNIHWREPLFGCHSGLLYKVGRSFCDTESRDQNCTGCVREILLHEILSTHHNPHRSGVYF